MMLYKPFAKKIVLGVPWRSCRDRTPSAASPATWHFASPVSWGFCVIGRLARRICPSNCSYYCNLEDLGFARHLEDSTGFTLVFFIDQQFSYIFSKMFGKFSYFPVLSSSLRAQGDDKVSHALRLHPAPTNPGRNCVVDLVVG